VHAWSAMSSNDGLGDILLCDNFPASYCETGIGCFVSEPAFGQDD
jgi:hypothetical protein